jgi:hypothetical protein
MDELEFLNERSANLTGLSRVLALAAADDARADAADARARAERQAEAERRAEVLAWGNRQLGNPLGELSRFRSEHAEADDRVRDLADQLEKATKKRDRLAEAIRGRTQQLDEITASLSRSAPLNDPVTVAADVARTAFLEHAAYVARSRQAWQAAQAGTGPRPFASRGGVAVRNEPVTCPECLKCGFTPEQSFEVHHSDVNGNPISASSDDVPVPVPPDDVADRSAAGYGQEISRGR